MKLSLLTTELPFCLGGGAGRVVDEEEGREEGRDEE
jgi:hypothetical protein